MKKMLLILVTLLLLCLCCATALAGSAMYVQGTTSDRVHLRANPTANAESLGLYFNGTVVSAENASASGWTKVTVGTEHGYMKSECLSSTAVVSMEPTGTVCNGSLHLRAHPSKESQSITSLPNGSSVLVHGETKDGWYFVTHGQRDGYVMKEFIRLGVAEPLRPSANPVDAALYRAVLSNTGAFFNLDTHRLAYANDALETEGPGNCFTGFALTDFDGDGTQEVAMRLGDDYGALLLKVSDGTVYGCTLTYRAFSLPKADGTFSFSSSAFESGFGYIQLTPDGTRSNDLAFSFLDDAGEIGYQVYGKRATADSFYEALDAQDSKPDLVWYPLSAVNDMLK